MGKKNVALPDNAKDKARDLFLVSIQAQERLQMYIQGCKDTLGLGGDWNLSTQTWMFEPMPKGKS